MSETTITRPVGDSSNAQASTAFVKAAIAAASATGSILQIENKASIVSVPAPLDGKVYWLKEYEANTDEGGGPLIYDAASTSTVNDGTVFAAPAAIGRFIRPVDGILHSNWFGLVSSTTLDQSAQFQAFLNEAIANSYTAYIDPGYIDCNGAQIYLNKTWSGNAARPGGGAGGTATGGPLYGFILMGANRRYSRLGHVFIHAGAIGAYGVDGLASGTFTLKDFFIDRGGVALWSTEVTTLVDGLRIFVGPACATAFDVPSTGLPGTIANTGFVTNAGLFAYGANQLNLRNVRIECPTTETASLYIGALLDAQTNTSWEGGGCNILGQGIVLKQTGLEFSQDSQNVVFRNLHFESCLKESLYVGNGWSVRIQGHFRGSDTVSGGAWDRANYPIIRVGDAAAATSVKGCTIRDSYFVGKSDLNATAILLDDCQDVSVTDNNFTTFVNGVVTRSTATRVAPTSRNNFVSVTNDVTRDQLTTYAVDPAVDRVAMALTETASIVYRVSAWPNAKLTIAAALTRNLQAPIGAQEGVTYRLTVTKTNASGSLTFDAIYKWPGGTAPNIAGMSTSQICKMEFYYDGTSMLGSYFIY